MIARSLVRRAFPFAWIAVTAVAPAQATDLPGNLDPGAQRERTRQELLQREREEEQREEVERDDPVEGGEGPSGGNLPSSQQTFTLEAVRFNASVFLDADWLDSVAADYTGRPVTFDDLNDMLGRINARYRERGLITAAAYIPPQTIDDGVLRVELLEGRLGKLRVEGNEYTSERFLRRSLRLAEGAIIDIPELRGSINRINRETPLSLRAGIEPGEQTGDSDIRIRVAEPPRYGASTFIDNNGSETTGEWRAGVVGTLSGLVGWADTLTAYAVGAEGSRNALLRYEVTVNRWGGRLDLSYSGGDIEVIEGDFAALDVTGDSSEAAIGYSQPIHDGEWVRTSGRIGYSDSESTSEIAGSVISDFSIAETSLDLDLAGGGRSSRWRLSQGARHAEVEALGAPEETFVRYPGDASWLRRFTAEWSGRVRLGWQASGDDRLPSSLVYQLGGSGSVRGYEQGVVSGDSGVNLVLAADYAWQAGLRQTVFVDYGQVDRGPAGDEDLASVGTGIDWRPLDGVTIDASVGFALEEIDPDQDDARAHVRLTWRPSLP